MIRGAAELRAKFLLIGETLPARLIRTIDQQDALLQAHIVRDKLSGQVLHRRSGRLSRSIHSAPARAEGGNVIGKVGTNVVYAPVHEFGATIRAKRAKYLRFKVQGRFVSVKEVTIPKRPFMKPSLEERRPAIAAAIRKTVVQVIHES